VTTNKTLIRALHEPEMILSLDAVGFAELMRLAQWEVLAGRLAYRAQQSGVIEKLDPVAADVLRDALIVTKTNQQRMIFELSRIDRALEDYEGPKILLKGLAYLALNLPGAEGRLCSDVDFLSPRNDLAEIEQLLRAHGWVAAKSDEYDEHYYREWMHELPPMRHATRGIIVDIHHAILPKTSRLNPAARLLIAEAQTCPLHGWKVLDGPDMAIHCALHTFYDGDLMGGLRGLFDFSDIMAHFAAQDPRFEQKLKRRAVELGVMRPLAYALRYLRLVLGCDDYKALEIDLRNHLPSRPILALMDHLVFSMFLKTEAWHREWGGWQRFFLYIRSHWLRMPPLMLARHLLRKWWKRRSASH
jgi:hypothetical protein